MNGRDLPGTSVLPDDVPNIQYTTGSPKGVPLTHAPVRTLKDLLVIRPLVALPQKQRPHP